MNNIEKVRELYESLPPIFNWKWLPSDPSKAFLVCIASGPWNIGRRKIVQQNALDILGTRDLTYLAREEIEQMFPLFWQRNTIIMACNAAYPRTFNEFSRDSAFAGMLVTATTVDKPLKVVQMFVRDFCCKPAFPIDRHVLAFLVKNMLPHRTEDMIKLCQEAGVDPCSFNRRIFGLHAKNPDWTNV